MDVLLGEAAGARKLRVVRDARLDGGEGTGVAAYGRALTAAWKAVGLRPRLLADNSVGRFGDPRGWAEKARRRLAAHDPRPRLLEEAEGGALLRTPDVFRLAQVRFDATGKLLRLRAPGPPGVMHWTWPVPALVEGWVNVHAVHDLVPLTHPHFAAGGQAFARRVRALAASSDALVAVSAHARDQVAALVGEQAAPVIDAGSAACDLAAAGMPLPPSLAPGAYLLAYGLVEPRKKLLPLVTAWATAGRPMPLVIAGPDGRDGPALRRRLAALGATLLPYQPRKHLMDLLVNARALLFPSTAEGFGLPIAEAMTLGVPVLAADHGAPAEVAGGAALAVVPDDPAALAAAVRRLATDDALAASLAAAGLARAALWTPATFGERLVRLYQSLVAARSGLA